MFKKTLLAPTFLAIFILAIVIWYSPIVFKGYPAILTAADGLVRAKNFALTGQYATENKLNVVLSTDLIKTQAQESNYGNKLGTIIYSYAIKIFHPETNNQVVLLNCFILALALLFFSLTIYYLFDFKTTLLFALIYIFLPFNWLLPQTLVGYEFALLFLSLFFLFFSLGTNKFTSLREEIKINFWPNGFYLILSGIFLILSCLAREAFFLILPILFVFLLFIKFKKQLLYIFIPAIIIFCLAWLPDFLTNKNTYLLFFTTKTANELKGSDYSYYAHIFPDPYNYHFANNQVIAEKQNFENADIMAKLGREKVLANMGQGSINLWQRLILGTTLSARHIARFFSLTEIGGPIIFCFLLLGMMALKKQKNYWFSFIISLFFSSIFLLAYINLAGRNHLMDWGILIALLVSFGIIYLTEIFSNEFKLSNKKKNLLILFLTLIIVYNLILVGHIMFGSIYDKNSTPRINYYAEKIKSANFKPTDIIALPLGADEIYDLNFLTNKSLIVFKEKTIEDLLTTKNLSRAFKEFKINYVLGYNEELSEKIIQTVPEVKLLGTDNIPREQINPNKNNKNWFLNLVK